MPDFKKYFVIPAPPEEVYAALTFEPTIELWTGSPAQFTPEVDAEFSMWDESIVGKLLRLEPGVLIQQEWYFGALEEPSVVTMKFHADKKGTSLEVHHINIPDEAYDDIKDGWINVYMKDLRDFYTE
jgi:uncharacterized protein YndB with AHSA1/START domain